MSKKALQINIPESLEEYKDTVFWNLTKKQIVIVFCSVLLFSACVFSIFSQKLILVFLLLPIILTLIIGLIEVNDRNIYQYIVFVAKYYLVKPKTYIYHHHHIPSKNRQINQDKINQTTNNKLYILISIIIISLVLFLIVSVLFLYYVITY